MKRVLVTLAWASFLVATATAGEVGFIEDFSLARNRAASLQQLIPGTEDFYYYQSLHALNTEQYEKVTGFVKPWLEQFGQTPRLTEIQTRRALLTYDRDPQKTLAYLKERLGLRFDHQRVEVGASPRLPTMLDQKLIARDTLLANSFDHQPNLENFEDSALDWLATVQLTPERRRALLHRMRYPDVYDGRRGLTPPLVAADLATLNAPEFGAFAIHKNLTQAQLEELLRLRPALLNQQNFVNFMLAKLQPGDDEDWRHDPQLAKAYLDRLLTFVRRLAPVHNTLKAHVIFNRLVFDRTQGTYDRALFLEYLKLPRQVAYVAKVFAESREAREHPADLNFSFNGVTQFPTVGNDEPVVRAYLQHFLVAMDSPKEFEPFIDDTYLRHLFAETKIVNGLGEAEQWSALLPPEAFRQLRDRVDIDFDPTNRTNFQANEPVRLDLHVKNAPTLLVKIFEINTTNYYRQNLHEVETDVNLDGLVANAERTHSYAESPLRRMARRFDFPQLNKPGVYVIDFIANGKSSRALVRKGKLHPTVATTDAGQRVTVVDDAKQLVKDTVLWMGGQEYKADKNGTILVPFSTSPGKQPIVLSHGDFACLDYLDHQTETYQLRAGIHVDREALLAGRVASVIVRPGLYLNGDPVAIKLLEEVKLRITATDLDGIPTSTEITDFKLFEDRESVHDFRVPPRLAKLEVQLLARVKSLSKNEKVDLAASTTAYVNGIAASDKIEDLHLAKFGAAWVIELLGRTGEAKPDRPVQVQLKHHDFKQVVQVTMKSDAQGRINLGPLAEIDYVVASGPEGMERKWTLPEDQYTYRATMQVRAGEVITLPYFGHAAKPLREEFALFAMRGDTIQADRFDALAIQNGMLELRGLAPGDYLLRLKRDDRTINIRVAEGGIVGNYVLGSARDLELPKLKPVQIASIVANDQTITIQLQDASKFTRVHVVATRYLPEHSAFADLATVRDAGLSWIRPAHAESAYLTGRALGDELRYVLDRRGQKKFPGNMLDRPALLLNPWAIRSTEAGEQAPQRGDEFDRKALPPGSEAGQRPAGGTGSGKAPRKETPDLDFLAEPSAVLLNLIPDKDGIVKVNRKELGTHQMVHVLAVDPLNVTYRTLTTGGSEPRRSSDFLDLRLAKGLDPDGHFTQQKQVTVLAPNQPFVIPDLASSRFEAYDNLAKVFGLYATLSKDPKLAEFTFILGWPTLKSEEKRTLYSKHACHELNFFLLKKDPEFFRTVVKPYLANKKDKTFLDQWLLDADVSEYAQPWRFGRLNVVERVLLAQRLPDEPAKTARHLGDLFRLLPPNPGRERGLFETAMLGRVLDTGPGLNFNNQNFFQVPTAGHKAPWADAKMEEKYSKRLQNKSGGTPDVQEQVEQKLGDLAGEKAKDGNGRAKLGRQTGTVTFAPPDAPVDRLQREGRADGEALYKGYGADKKAELEVVPGFKLGMGYRFSEREAMEALQLYRQVSPTQEWAENNYYKLPIQQQLADLVTVNAFWLDYAKHDGKSPFLSPKFPDAAHNFTEMMLALSVLDLPFTSGKHDAKFDGPKMTFTPAGPVIAFHEEVRAVAAPAKNNNAAPLVSQNFYKLGDRFREEAGEKIDKFVTDEFIIQTVYGCQVVVTNPTSARQRLSVLVQTPVGSIPVANGQFTKTILVELEPYHTQTIDYHFYFPMPGRFAHFPVQVAKNEAIVAAAQPFTFNVVAKPTKIDTDSWDYVSQFGTNDQVIALLNRENVNALDLGKIAFRMKDRAFFETAIQLLQGRHVYHPTLWSYALFHNVVPPARQYLLSTDQIVNECGGPLTSTLLTVDPVARYQYEHLEYKPLVNARAHPLGKRRQIVNQVLLDQYHRFLKTLSYKQHLGDEDMLAVTYYLLLQDRIDEALNAFSQVNAEKVATRIQYDYCNAYLDLFSDDPLKARAIAAQYANHPVDRWRNAFAAITSYLNEIEGQGAKIVDADDRNQQQNQFASKEGTFAFTIDNKAIDLAWQNLESVKVNYYLMDVELLFSRNPFVQQGGSQFAAIKPNATKEVTLPKQQTKLAIPLPEEFAKRNVLVEVVANGKTQALPYYANAMTVKLAENYGQLTVTDATTNRGLSKVYVKTYVRLANGQVKFHKDGYTDLRGRFDYATVSTPEPVPPQQFAILVLSEDHGAQIKEAAPPQR